MIEHRPRGSQVRATDFRTRDVRYKVFAIADVIISDPKSSSDVDAYQVRWHRSLSEPLSTVVDQDDDATQFFQTAHWFRHLHDCGIAKYDGLYVAQVKSSDGQEWVLPLQLHNRSLALPFGRSLAGLSNFYSSLFGPARDASSCTESSCRAFVASMREHVPGAAVLDLHPLDADAEFVQRMQSALANSGYWTDRYFCFGNWYLPVHQRDWATIEKTLSSRQRNTTQRARRKLDRTKGFNLHIHEALGPELELAINDYERVQASSWKRPEPFDRFVSGLCRWTAEKGWLRLGIVRVGDAPIAAQIWFVYRRSALIFKLAYDESHKQLSAGSVLTAALMQQVIDVDKVEIVDYLTGDDPYKADWMSHRRERVGLIAFDPLSMAGLLGGALHFLRSMLRKVSKR